MVSRCHEEQQCAGPGKGCLYLRGPEENSPVAGTIGGKERPEKGQRLSVGYVYADLLYQPRREEPAGKEKESAGGGKGSIEIHARKITGRDRRSMQPGKYSASFRRSVV
jgi:hypothetical protein